jgi:GrpB-like predicted nucleotidyltransferase (UPF0157 family)
MPEPGTTTIRIPIADHNRLQDISEVREGPVGWFASVFLCYGMNHIDEAIDEWQQRGADREAAHLREPVKLHAVTSGSSASRAADAQNVAPLRKQSGRKRR